MFFFILEAAQQKTLFRSIFYITFYSVTLPDNYTTQVLSIILLFMAAIRAKKDMKIGLGLFLFLCSFIFSIIINNVPAVNVLLFIVFNLFFWCSWDLAAAVQIDETGNIRENLLNIVYIQLFAALCSLLKAILMNQAINPDNFGGMYVRESSYIFVSTLTIICIYLYFEYSGGNDRKRNMSLIVLCIAASLLSSVMHVTVSIIAAVIGYLVVVHSAGSNRFLNTIYIYLPLFILTGYLAVFLFQKEFLYELGHILGSYELLSGRIAKVESYIRVFMNIPSQDFVFMIFGSGPGYFSSRAALTATGVYIEAYNKLGLEISVSKYTGAFVLPFYYYFNNIYRNGVEDFPYSTLISTMGEMGLTGLAALFSLLLGDLKKFCTMGKANRPYFFACILPIFLLMLFIWDNYTEYPKVVFVLFAVRNMFYRSFINNATRPGSVQ